MRFDYLIWLAGTIMEGLGVAVIVGGAILAIVAALVRLAQSKDRGSNYSSLRHSLGRAILLGLELLVAADIIRTVSEAPTLNDVLVLGGIVLIRTFLSFSLEVELDGKWPWQKPHSEPA